MSILNKVLLICCLLLGTSQVEATFSIVAVDPVTGQIGSAGATCINSEDGALWVSDIVSNVGVVHTQAFWNQSNQANARARMIAGDTPQEIMDWLVANDINGNPQSRQYLAVSLNGGSPLSAGFSGNQNGNQYNEITGPNYAIAGNILISQDVLIDMETAFVNSNGTLAEKLMAALQGAKRAGADSRCEPYGVSSASAFIRVARSCDVDTSYGNLPLDLNVWFNSFNNPSEPIDTLQTAFDSAPGLAACSGDSYTVGGNVNDLNGSITLKNNGNNDVTLNGDGAFVFPAQFDGTTYNVTVSDSPANQSCVVTNGTGTVSGGDVTNVSVVCTNMPFNQYCFNTPTTVPDDFPAGVNTTLNVPDSGTLTELMVTLDISHSYVGDIDVSLEHMNSSTRISLMDRPGVPATQWGCSGNDIDTLFDDMSSVLVEGQCNNSSPTIGPDSKSEQVLAAFNGLDQSGDWVLNVSDNGGGDTGTINSWCLMAVTGSVQQYTVGGSVSDLTGSVTLQNSGSNSITVNSNGNFTFAPQDDGTAYAVSVTAQPSRQTCSVSNGGGNVNGGNVSNVAVSCQFNNSTANPDAYMINEDSAAVTLDVLANDTSSINGPSPISNVTQPANGTVAIINSGNNLSYQANADYCNSGGSTDDFTYTINGGSTASVAMTVDCVNDEPDFAYDASVYVNLSDTSNPLTETVAVVVPSTCRVPEAALDPLVEVQSVQSTVCADAKLRVHAKIIRACECKGICMMRIYQTFL